MKTGTRSKSFDKSFAFHRFKSVLVAGLSLYMTTQPLLPQDKVFSNSLPAASLIELYSSEGCSSCPPAEAWTSRLKSAPGLWKDIFPVAFHVDYWDGLGWPDRFARAEYTQRQRDYAAHLGQDSVYTPEFIVNGLEWRRGWFDGQTLPLSGAGKRGSLSLTVNAQDKKFSGHYSPGANSPRTQLLLNVALVGFNVSTNVKRGENAGSTLAHDFVVLAFKTIPLIADGDKSFRSDPVEIKSSTGDQPGAVVAWVSQGNGTILQVVGGWLSSPDVAGN